MSESRTNGGLLGPAQIRQLAAEHGINPTKKLGQNFVHDAGTVRKIVTLAGVRPGDVVLEVGPGLGSLTLGLLEAGATVEAIELDPRLAEALPGTVALRAPDWASRLRVTNADATELEPGDLFNQPSLLVANLPYNVAVPILLTALERLPGLRRALVMVQREVADRLVAAPGSRTYGTPSVKLAWYGESKRVGIVGPNVFWPKPNVDSALVSLAVREPARGSARLREATFGLVDRAFEQRRKMLRASLKEAWPGARAESVLEQAGISPQARPESLTVEQFMALAQAGAETDPSKSATFDE